MVGPQQVDMAAMDHQTVLVPWVPVFYLLYLAFSVQDMDDRLGRDQRRVNRTMFGPQAQGMAGHRPLVKVLDTTVHMDLAFLVALTVPVAHMDRAAVTTVLQAVETQDIVRVTDQVDQMVKERRGLTYSLKSAEWKHQPKSSVELMLIPKSGNGWLD